MAKAIPICWVDNGDAFGRRSLPWKRLSEGPLPRIWRRRLEGGALSCCGGGRFGLSEPLYLVLCLLCFFFSSLWSVQLGCWCRRTSQWLPGHWRFDLATTWSLEALELVVSFAVATWSLAVLPRDFLVA